MWKYHAYTNKYKPIALATVTSRMLECIMLQRIDEATTESDNQFCFKQSLSTDMCIYLLKEMADYTTRDTKLHYLLHSLMQLKLWVA